MTRSKWLILCLLFGCTIQTYASELIATVKAYNQAELSGDVPLGTEVAFYNTSESKGQLTAGSVATMTFANLPLCTITKITFYVKSNSKSGAGSLKVTLGGAPIVEVLACDFADWPGTGGYSTSYVPVSFTESWFTNKGSNMVCQIEAMVNSLGWDKVVVTYSEIMPDPRTVTLQWFDADGGIQSSSLSEKSSGSGIVLPDCSVPKVVSSDEWTFVGWTTEQHYGKYTSEPNAFKAGEKFYPSDNQTLYALYSYSPDVTDIVQTTNFVSGEYAMIMHAGDEYFMAQGAVNKKQLLTVPCEVFINNDDIYQLSEAYVPVYCRYQLDFTTDSVQVKNLASGEIIGHYSTYLSDKNAKWAWHEAKNHSLELSYDSKTTASGTSARVLWLTIAESSPCFTIEELKLGSDYEFMLLFDVSDVPTTQPQTRWTSCPFECEQAVENIVKQQHNVRKIFRNGILYIEINNVGYDMLGNKIN